MISDDLTTLFDTGKGTDQEFRKGVVVSWNVTTGSNAITVGSTTLTDVPFFSPGGLVVLLAGDAVMLLRLRTSWFIVGRVVSVGGTKAIGHNTQAAAAVNTAPVTGFALSTTLTTVVTWSTTLPVWANQITFMAFANVIANNPTATAGLITLKVADSVSGGYEQFSSPTVPAGVFGVASAALGGSVNVTPGSAYSITAQVAASAAWAANASNAAHLTVTAIYNSN